MTAFATGDRVPEFELPDADGVVVRSSDLIGRPFVLYFYPKDDTSGCTSEAKDFTALADGFAAIDVAVLGVSPDPVAKHARFRDKHALAVRLLSDEEKTLVGPLGLYVEKSMYGRTYMGVERTTILFDAQGCAQRIWPKVRVAGHAQEVLDAARDLAAQA